MCVIFIDISSCNKNSLVNHVPQGHFKRLSLLLFLPVIPWMHFDYRNSLGTASFATLLSLASLLIFTSLREAQQRTFPGIPAGPKPSCWLCLSLLGSATSAHFYLLPWLYWTGLLVYLWHVCEWIQLLPLTRMNVTADFLTNQMGFSQKKISTQGY